ncbi:phage holin [Enterovibrio norvegicus]|uniref:phage holin n=1 Tax=Enterovibrio norvegicus TaxID=188144 RepID=UPI0024B0BBB4|nr:phage holin [Enterovibrio norvegicus]
MSELATPTAYASSFIMTIAGLTINEWVALGGLFIGVATFAVNWWYKHVQTKIMQDKQDLD